MKIIDSFLFDAGWLFFATWSLIIAVVSLAAFGPDLLRSKVPLAPRPKAPPAACVRPTQSSAR